MENSENNNFERRPVTFHDLEIMTREERAKLTANMNAKEYADLICQLMIGNLNTKRNHYSHE